MADVRKPLDALLRGPKTLPVLFTGSGLSRRYLGVPDWRGVLQVGADLVGKDISYYIGRANSDLPKAASLIANDLYDPWFTESRFAASRNAVQAQVSDFSHPLKYELAKYVSGLKVVGTAPIRAELATFKDVRVHAVLTTNWDTSLENILPGLQTFVGQSNVLFAQMQGVGELYKIHGSVEDPSGMVLTEEDYEQYWDKNPYLMAKLLTLFVEHPVVIVGYSMSDPHILRMLNNFLRVLTAQQVSTLNDRIIFVRRTKAHERAVLQRQPMMLDGQTLEVQELALRDYGTLWKIMADLPMNLSVGLIRQFRQQIYDLALTTPPKGKIHVLGINDSTNLSKVELVIGVGTMARLGEKGWEALGRLDAFQDMLKGEANYGAEPVLTKLLPRMFTLATYSPIFYPLWVAGRVDTDGNVPDQTGLPAKGLRLLTATNPFHVTSSLVAAHGAEHFRDALASNEKAALNAGLVCQYDEEDVLALQKFLTRSFEDVDKAIPTELARLACKYDRLVFGPDYAGDRAALHVALGVPTRVAGL